MLILSDFKIAHNVCGTQQVGLYLYCRVGLYALYGSGTQLFCS